jgi:glycosyltransferase involved in cell wall biosynthesis
VSRRVVITTEIIAPYRVPVFNALAAHPGIKLHVIFLAETDPTMRQWHIPREEIAFAYEVLPHWRHRLAGYNLLVNRSVAAALDRARPDAIVCGGYNYLASWQVLRWGRRRKVPILLWSESNPQDRRRALPHVEFLKRRFLRACSGFIVPGKSAAAYLQTFGVPASAIFTAPNAVDNDFFARESSRARAQAAALRHELKLPERYFLYAGRLIPSKGVFDLLEAYSCLDPGLRREVGLVFVGDGAGEPALKSRAAQIHPGTIHFAGFAQRAPLAVYYALAETFVFPTHTDPWGLVVNEAMACGLPVIVSDAAGCVPDLVPDAWNGAIVPARDAGQLSAVMTRFAQDAATLASMGTHSAERILHNSPEACAAGFVQAVAAQLEAAC